MIDESEKEDFVNAISDQGLDPSDFELSEQEDPMHGEGVQPITGRAIIKRKSNGVERSYASGHGSRWSAEFAEDLKRGLFKRC